MTNDEIKAFISAKVSEGISLSKIQDALLNEKGVRMTYMELRMLASEIETADWQKLDKQKAEKTPPAQPQQAGQTGNRCERIREIRFGCNCRLVPGSDGQTRSFQCGRQTRSNRYRGIPAGTPEALRRQLKGVIHHAFFQYSRQKRSGIPTD